jgi:hypothetical protein
MGRVTKPKQAYPPDIIRENLTSQATRGVYQPPRFADSALTGWRPFVAC